MNDELQKLQEVQHLNDQLVLENKRLQAHNIELTNELNNLRAQSNSSELQQKLIMQEERFRNHLIQIKKYTKGLLGYDMEINEDTVELLSLYAFERSDKVVFQVSGKNLNLMSNEFIDEYKELVDMYLVKGKSIPAFLSGITMDLVNKKTFQ